MAEEDPANLPEEFSRPQILFVMGLTAVLLLVVAKVWQHLAGVALFPLQVTGSAIAWGMAAAVAITLISQGAYYLWPGYRSSADRYLQLVLSPLVLTDLIWLGLLPGLSEELLFRGVMLPSLGGNWLAVVATSCVFGLLHLNGLQQWSYAVWAAIVGAILGAIALLTGNLLVPVVAHIGTNMLAGAIWKLGRWRSENAEG
ncbi:MAG: CPBP family intramembrane glutamic endopeptidase [Cyanobacteria bacterium J06641_5]